MAHMEILLNLSVHSYYLYHSRLIPIDGAVTTPSLHNWARISIESCIRPTFSSTVPPHTTANHPRVKKQLGKLVPRWNKLLTALDGQHTFDSI